MAILEQNSTESKSGFKKTIDNADIGVILNIVQVSLYQFPFKSTVREIVSNAIDANKEKEIARMILTGAASVQDYYIENDDPAYKDSKFDADYYDLRYLDPLNIVNIDYYVNKDITQRDLLSIRDSGVGLGGYRLEKFFSPGASTKRLNKQALGKFGIGNKSPLSTGIGVYKLISHYNGMKFVFDIYEDKIDPLIGRFDVNGNENDFIVFDSTLDARGNPIKIYYEPSTEKNSVEIQVEIKKHNRREITEAVKSQLMYFKDNIVFTEHDGDYENDISFKSPILYEDSDLIIPVNTSYYNRPHFVMNSVCYGLIDFQELELSARYGCVGIKVDPSEIDVNPSRESVAYTQKTKETILAKYDSIVNKIEGLIKEELKVKDPIEWLRTVNSIVLSNYSNNSSNQVLSKMSGLIDKASIRPVYSVDDIHMKYESDLKSFMSSYFKVERVSLQGYGTNRKIGRDNQDAMSAFNMKNVYLQLGAGSAARTSYLVKTSENNNYLSIRLNFPSTLNTDVAAYYVGDKTLAELNTAFATELKDKVDIERSQRAIKALDFLKQSKHFNVYDDVVVPDGYNTEGDEESANIVFDRAAEVAKMRKQQGKIVVGLAQDNYGSVTFSSAELSLSAMPENTWYGFTDDRDSIIAVGKLLRKDNDLDPVSNLSYVDQDTRVFRIAKNLATRFKNFDHVDTFGFTIDNDTLKCTSRTLKYSILKNYINNLFRTLDLDINKVYKTLRIIGHRDLKYANYLKTISEGSLYLDESFKAKVLIERGINAQMDIFAASVNKPIDEDTKADIIDSYFLNLNDEEITDYILDIDIITEDDYNMILDIVELANVYDDLPYLFDGDKLTSYSPSAKSYHLSRNDYSSRVKNYIDILLDNKRQLLTRDYSSIFNN